MTGDSPALALADCRIQIRRRTARWDEYPVTIADAADFWGAAASAANVIMQLSWPGVGHGVVEQGRFGNLLKHPWKRARTTFQYLAVAILGNDEDRTAMRKAVDTAHRQVQSGPDSPVRYNAFDRDLQMWVAACLFVGMEDVYQLLRGELTPELAEQFYRSAARWAPRCRSPPTSGRPPGPSSTTTGPRPAPRSPWMTPSVLT